MPLDDKTLQRLRNNDSTLTKLNLANNQISDAGAKSIAHALLHNSSLTWLNLYYNQISAAGAKSIADAITHNASLATLYLGDNKISAAGGKSIANALTHNASLTTLGLQNNQISDAGAKSIADALLKNSSLTLLDLRSNQISDAIQKKIDSLMERNQQYVKGLQARACEQLRIGRILLYKAVASQESESILSLPLKLREKVIKSLGGNVLMTEEQQRLILDYAGGKKDDKGEMIISPVADKLSFFKATKCDSVRKQLKQDEVEAASRSFASTV